MNVIKLSYLSLYKYLSRPWKLSHIPSIIHPSVHRFHYSKYYFSVLIINLLLLPRYKRESKFSLSLSLLTVYITIIHDWLTNMNRFIYNILFYEAMVENPVPILSLSIYYIKKKLGKKKWRWFWPLHPCMKTLTLVFRVLRVLGYAILKFQKETHQPVTIDEN